MYEDYNRSASFLIAPQELSLEAWAARADAPDGDGAIFTAASSMPFKLFLFRLDLPYVSADSTGDIRNDFGDPAFRLRFRAWSGRTKAVYILSSVRLGSLPFLSPDENLYPYATGSLDFGLGVAYVDTTGSVTWWASGSATRATRVAVALSADGLYGDHADCSAGIAVSPTENIRFQVGAAGNFPTGESSRQIYFGSLDWAYSSSTAFFVSGQAEGGPSEDRVFDYAIGVGSRITF